MVGRKCGGDYVYEFIIFETYFSMEEKLLLFGNKMYCPLVFLVEYKRFSVLITLPPDIL